MAEFLLELYVSKTDRGAAAGTAERFARAAAQDADGAERVRLVRSIFVPADETCYLLVEAGSVEDVREAARRAALPVEHVVSPAVDTEY